MEAIEITVSAQTDNSSEKLYVAETWRRVLGFFIDQMIAAVFLAPIFAEIVSGLLHHQAVVIPWRTLIPCVFLLLAYQIVFLRLLGATVGKLLFGLRVVNFHNHQFPTWMQALLRVLADHLSFFVGQSLRVLAFGRFDRRHVSDWVAETQVMQKKPRLAPARPRLILMSFLFLYFLVSGIFSAYRLIQRSEWDQHNLTLHPGSDIFDSEEAGSD